MSATTLAPRAAGKFIAERAKDVKIIPEGVQKLARVMAQAVKEGKLDMKAFKQNEVLPLDRGLSTEQLANWIFLVDALNFSFWTPDNLPKFTVSYKGKTCRGYLAMVTAVNRAIDEGHMMHDPAVYSQLTMEDLQHIFRSDTTSQMPLMEERLRVVQEIGGILKEKFQGSFVTLLQQADCSSLKLVELVVENFPCFQDTAVLEGQSVGIYKRVQILAADVWMLYRGKGLGAFRDIDQLTMFADYRIPQTLAYFGAIEYSEKLTKMMHDEHLFQNGDREEVEIRGVSIEVIEQVVEAARKLLQGEGAGSGSISSIEVDFFLWDYRVNHAKELLHIPYHRVRCIFY